MRFLRLTLAPDLISPSSAVTQGAVCSIQYRSDGTVTELYALEGDIDTILEQLAKNPETYTFEHLGTQNGRHYVFHSGRPTAEMRALVELLDAHRLLVVLPLRFDGSRGVTVDIVGDGESLQEAYRRFPDEIRRRTTIEQVGDYVPTRHGPLSVLTARQREVLAAAVAVGYYSVPRTATAEDVADAVGCAPSTASEHLRKLEARVFSHLIEPHSSNLG